MKKANNLMLSNSLTSHTVAFSIAATALIIPEQLQQNLLIGEALLTSPYNLVECGLLTPDVLSIF